MELGGIGNPRQCVSPLSCQGRLTLAGGLAGAVARGARCVQAWPFLAPVVVMGSLAGGSTWCRRRRRGCSDRWLRALVAVQDGGGSHVPGWGESFLGCSGRKPCSCHGWGRRRRCLWASRTFLEVSSFEGLRPLLLHSGGNPCSRFLERTMAAIGDIPRDVTRSEI